MNAKLTSRQLRMQRQRRHLPRKSMDYRYKQTALAARIGFTLDVINICIRHGE